MLITCVCGWTMTMLETSAGSHGTWILIGKFKAAVRATVHDYLIQGSTLNGTRATTQRKCGNQKKAQPLLEPSTLSPSNYSCTLACWIRNLIFGAAKTLSELIIFLAFSELSTIWHFRLSFKVWLCGGKIEYVPCSWVAHMYKGHTYTVSLESFMSFTIFFRHSPPFAGAIICVVPKALN